MGECMVEIGSANDSKLCKQSFAGDVFNTGIYIKRCLNNKANVKFLTVAGNDPLSDQMIAMMHQEQLDSSLVYRSAQKKLGLYLINIDDEGERSFTYWRENSAARQLVKHIKQNDKLEKMKNIDMLFFSGISIAILEPKDLAFFWQYIKNLKTNGCKIIFDPNYRAALWRSSEVTRQAFDKAYSLSDVVLPGVEDHVALYDCHNADEVADYLESFKIKEIIIKNGSEGVLVSIDGKRSYIDIEAVKNVIDTTSAGDSFNAGYLSARLSGCDASDSVKFAANVAGCVIQHKGAIISSDAFRQHLCQYPMQQGDNQF
jgi:2-dehydro-3-deoxygluconokinase